MLRASWAPSGLIEGREAGRLDRIQRGVWDLEGQTELEQRFGYNSGVGPQAIIRRVSRGIPPRVSRRMGHGKISKKRQR